MKKQELPSLPLFTDKFLAETAHLNICEIGIYIKLICWCWTKKRGVTEEEAIKIVNDEEYNKSTKYVLKEFFYYDSVGTGKFKHKRLEQEFEYLTLYYANKRRSGRVGGLNSTKQTASKMQPPISIPISIPNNNNNSNFEIFWNKLFTKKGSKKIAKIRYLKECEDEDPEKISIIFNSFIKAIKEEKYIPHVATWLNQRRFEDEDVKPFNIGPTLIEKMKKIGYKHIGSQDHYEQFTKDNKKWKVHKWKKDAIIEEDK